MLRCASVLLVGVLTTGLVACGVAPGGRHAPSAAAAPPPASSLAGSCTDIVRNELADVARRIYAQAVDGGGVVSAVKRLRRSAALASALASGDRAAVEAAFLPIRHQIVRIELLRDGKPIYAFGHSPSFAPIRGTLRDADGRVAGSFVLAVTDRTAYAGIVKRLTGATVAFRSAGSTALDGHERALSLATSDYPSGPLRIEIKVPRPSRALCARDPQVTRANAIAYVGRRLLRAERHSRDVSETLRHVAADPAFRRATALNDKPAMRSAIIDDFFRDHSFHIVRVRVMRGAKLIYDLGGPYVLQPVTGTVLSPDGRTSATFMTAVQDDTGYIKLVHRFTGAAVQLLSPLGKVPGSTLDPGPGEIPDSGAITYRRQRYIVESLTGTAFPSGPLRISLLVPAT
jgi:hypothetical protein